ncbi:bacteriohemerythrin [Brachyspira murdochii]|uniref:bacteriohemerythrin n=1 Tax=Brachyspira murdochii TaxID=84378 RepID=UPI0030050CF2
MSDRYIVWEDKYKTGYKRIDDQHFELIEIINDLYDCMDNRDSEDEKLKEAFKNALKKTVDYVSYHFSCEEKIMTAIKYRKLLEHSSSHREFTQTIYDYVQSYENGSLEAVNNLVKYLRDWLLNHVLVSDKEFVGEVIDALKQLSQQNNNQ